jgi:hypothetical protein
VETQCPVEWCVYGRALGTYIIACHIDPYVLAYEHGRVPCDGTRMIRLVDPRNAHAHGPGGCIPTIVLYGSKSAYDVSMAINRSLVAGERILEL